MIVFGKSELAYLITIFLLLHSGSMDRYRCKGTNSVNSIFTNSVIMSQSGQATIHKHTRFMAIAPLCRAVFS